MLNVGGNGFSITGLIAGEFNGDGKLDIAFTSVEVHSVGVLTGNGDGTFRSVVAYYDTAQDAEGHRCRRLQFRRENGFSRC